MDEQIKIPILHHYTSNQGLVGMLEKQELWFTDIRFLNDSKEFKHACGMLEVCIRNRAAVHRAAWIGHGCDSEEYARMIVGMCAMSSHEGVLGTLRKVNRGVPFVFCLTEKEDDLNQWRSYGNGHYCISFDFNNLDFHLKPKKVVYGEKDDEPAELQRAVDRFFVSNANGNFQYGRVHPEVPDGGMEGILLDLSRNGFFARHKDESFKEESEWRLVIDLDQYTMRQRNEDFFFTSDGRYPRPRFKSKLFNENSEHGIVDAIKKIRCGPGLDYEIFKTSIEMLRASSVNSHKTKKYLGNFETLNSNIPYRVD